MQPEISILFRAWTFLIKELSGAQLLMQLISSNNLRARCVL